MSGFDPRGCMRFITMHLLWRAKQMQTGPLVDPTKPLHTQRSFHIKICLIMTGTVVKSVFYCRRVLLTASARQPLFSLSQMRDNGALKSLETGERCNHTLALRCKLQIENSPKFSGSWLFDLQRGHCVERQPTLTLANTDRTFRSAQIENREQNVQLTFWFFADVGRRAAVWNRSIYLHRWVAEAVPQTPVNGCFFRLDAVAAAGKRTAVAAVAGVMLERLKCVVGYGGVALVEIEVVDIHGAGIA